MLPRRPVPKTGRACSATNLAATPVRGEPPAAVPVFPGTPGASRTGLGSPAVGVKPRLIPIETGAHTVS